MEEILEILDREIALKKSRTTADEIKVAASDIELYIKEKYVEKEFMRWKELDTYRVENEYDVLEGEKFIRIKTLDELHEYWFNHPELHKDK